MSTRPHVIAAGLLAGTLATGCCALQVDGAGFTSVIVFAVQAGPIPPG